jgi:tRNA-modifying protein YgfZ
LVSFVRQTEDHKFIKSCAMPLIFRQIRMIFFHNKSSQFHPYRPMAWIAVTGEDACTFLQGQFTNELRHAPGSATYGLWLNQKGKVVADSVVLRRAENEFLLLSTTSVAAVILQRLEQYIIADDVLLQDETEKTAALALWGAGCGELLKSEVGFAPERGRFLQRDELLIVPGRRTREENFELIGPEGALMDWQNRLVAQGCVEGSVDAVEFARISAGIPAVPQDIGLSDLPNEAEFEPAAISSTKGCYLGQEVMARLKNRGQVRRQLRGVRGTGPMPKRGTPLFQGAKRTGEIRSAVVTGEGFIALAMLTRLGLDEKAGFSFEAADEPVHTTTVWMS